MEEDMNAYVYFTESVIYFTPSAVTLIDHEHVTISVFAPAVPCPIWRRRRAESMQHEMMVRIPSGFDEKVWVFVYIDKHPRQKLRNWFILEVEVNMGVITDVITLKTRRPEGLNPSGVMVKYPNGAYDTSGYEWHKYQIP